MSVAQRVKQIIVEQLGVDENQVDDSASFVDDWALIRWILSNWSWLLKKRSISTFPMRMPKKSRPSRTLSITSKPRRSRPPELLFGARCRRIEEL